MTPSDRKLVVQIVGQVLISDGMLSDPEREHLDALMDRLEMEPPERSEALSGISVDSPVEERVKALSDEGRAAAVDEATRALGIGVEGALPESPLLARIRAAAV